MSEVNQPEISVKPLSSTALFGIVEEFLTATQKFSRESVVWAWIPDIGDWGDFDDVAEGYVIVSAAASISGLIVYSRIRCQWEPKPATCRPVIKRMLGLCDGDVLIVRPSTPRIRIPVRDSLGNETGHYAIHEAYVWQLERRLGLSSAERPE